MAGSTRRNQLRKHLEEAQGSRCFYCAVHVEKPIHCISRSTDATFDHVVPRFYGGEFSQSNIVLACRHCNDTKANWIIPGYIWRDRPELVRLLATGECVYGRIEECCGTPEDFQPRTKLEILNLWKKTSQTLNVSLPTSMKLKQLQGT